MSYFGIPRGRRKPFAQVRLVTDSGGLTHLYRDGVLQNSVGYTDPITYGTAQWTELVSSSQNIQNVNQIEIFDSSGNTALLGTGGTDGVNNAASAVLIHITPGGNGVVCLRIDAGTRIAIKPLTTPSNNCEFLVNFYD